MQRQNDLHISDTIVRLLALVQLPVEIAGIQGYIVCVGVVHCLHKRPERPIRRMRLRPWLTGSVEPQLKQ